MNPHYERPLESRSGFIGRQIWINPDPNKNQCGSALLNSFLWKVKKTNTSKINKLVFFHCIETHIRHTSNFFWVLPLFNFKKKMFFYKKPVGLSCFDSKNTFLYFKLILPKTSVSSI